MDINTSALTNREAMRFARRVGGDVAAGATLAQAIAIRRVPECLQHDVEYILQAIQEGWFALPAGPNLTYSKSQHGTLSRLISRSPWFYTLQVRAHQFEASRQAVVGGTTRAFGVVSLPNWGDEAAGIESRLPRLPREHRAGAITLDLLVQVLLDSQARAALLFRQMACLEPAWMWRTDHCLSDQIARLSEFDCLHLLKAYVSTTRNRGLDPFERQLLGDVQYRGLSPAEYERRWQVEQHRRADEAQAGWQDVYARIRQLASILDGVTSYHPSTLSRRLRQESREAFRLQRRGELVVEVKPNYLVGQGMHLTTGFLLVNYCQALADATQHVAPTFDGYLMACRNAQALVGNLA
ncbi:hypothetical protein [Pseudomonas guariconensis]|uniref:hypothetical protein n=1 Tax=Pseudomonas guariconensis TaxID=1288410 RepID=UPI0039066DFD